MDQAIQQALSLLLVGMTTVALVLGLVVLAGRALIQIVNSTTSSPGRGTPKHSPPVSNGLDPAIVAAITVAVDVATEGRGTVKKIDPQ